MGAHDHAIVVGIARYPAMPNLDGPSLDAMRFARWLRSSDGGNVPADQLEMVFTGSCRFRPRRPTRIDHAHPTSLDFEDAYNRLVERPRQDALAGRIGRRLYLYFSGHGFSSVDGLHLALYSARAKEGNYNHIPVTHFARGLWQEALFEEIVLVMDCCRDVEPWKIIQPPAVSFLANPGAAAAGRLYRAFATGYGRPAIDAQAEPLPDGSPGGVFTWVLLEALARAAAEADGRVTGQAVSDHVHTLWPELKAKYKCPSDPDIKFEEGGDITWLVRSAAAKLQATGTRVVLLGPGLADGTTVIISGGQPLRELASVELRGGRAETILASSALYKAEVPGTGRQQIFQAVGERIDVQLNG